MESATPASGGNGETRQQPVRADLNDPAQIFHTLMERVQFSQQSACATLNKFRKEGADVNKHGAELFGILKGIHDNQVIMMTSLAALWLRQANAEARRKQAAGGIIVPGHAGRG